MIDVCECDLALTADNSVTDLQLGETLSEWMFGSGRALRSGEPARADCGEDAGCALYGGPRHVVQNSADATQLLTAAGTAGTAVYEDWKGRAVAGGFLGVVAVQHEHSAVKSCETQHQSTCDVGVGIAHRGAEASLATGREFDRIERKRVGPGQRVAVRGIRVGRRSTQQK